MNYELCIMNYALFHTDKVKKYNWQRYLHIGFVVAERMLCFGKFTALQHVGNQCVAAFCVAVGNCDVEVQRE